MKTKHIVIDCDAAGSTLKTMLAEHLRARNYATGAFVGAYPLDSYFGLDQGFTVYDDAFRKREGSIDDGTADRGERPADPAPRDAHRMLLGLRLDQIAC